MTQKRQELNRELSALGAQVRELEGEGSATALAKIAELNSERARLTAIADELQRAEEEAAARSRDPQELNRRISRLADEIREHDAELTFRIGHSNDGGVAARQRLADLRNEQARLIAAAGE